MAHEPTDMMKAAAIARFGGLDELKTFDIPKPQAQAGEVLIRVHAAGVGIWDSKQRQGELAPDKPEFPMVLGAECAGEIDHVGAGVTNLKMGEPVYTYFYGKQGAYAQYVAVQADAVAQKPGALSFIEAAGVPVDGITAHQAITDEIKLGPDEWFFVAGASGGVGSLAVQIAANIGAHVIASARAENFAYLESLGVARDNLIDYTQSDVPKAVHDITGGRGADAALDAVGGESSKQTIKAVKDGGRLAELTGEELPPERNIRIAHIESKPSADRLDLLRDMFESGQLKIHIYKVFALAHARDAQSAVEHPHGPGKIVLDVA